MKHSLEDIRIGRKVRLIKKSIGMLTLEEFIEDSSNVSTFYRENGYLPIYKIQLNSVYLGDKISRVEVAFDDFEIIE